MRRLHYRSYCWYGSNIGNTCNWYEEDNALYISSINTNFHRILRMLPLFWCYPRLFKSDLYAPDTEMTFEFWGPNPCTEYG